MTDNLIRYLDLQTGDVFVVDPDTYGDLGIVIKPVKGHDVTFQYLTGFQADRQVTRTYNSNYRTKYLRRGKDLPLLWDNMARGDGGEVYKSVEVK